MNNIDTSLFLWIFILIITIFIAFKLNRFIHKFNIENGRN